MVVYSSHKAFFISMLFKGSLYCKHRAKSEGHLIHQVLTNQNYLCMYISAATCTSTMKLMCIGIILSVFLASTLTRTHTCAESADYSNVKIASNKTNNSLEARTDGE